MGRLRLPLFLERVSAGFPSPADDFIDERLSLDEHLIRHPLATFFLRASGQSMIGAGIHHDDLVIVDRSLAFTEGRVVVAVDDGDLTIKRLIRHQGALWLSPENRDYPMLPVRDDTRIWGVATYAIHAL